jgi:hypothetical protein
MSKATISDLVYAKKQLEDAEKFAIACDKAIEKGVARPFWVKIDFSSGIWHEESKKVTWQIPAGLNEGIRDIIEERMKEIVSDAILKMRNNVNELKSTLEGDIKSLLKDV